MIMCDNKNVKSVAEFVEFTPIQKILLLVELKLSAYKVVNRVKNVYVCNTYEKHIIFIRKIRIIKYLQKYAEMYTGVYHEVKRGREIIQPERKLKCVFFFFKQLTN